VRFKMTLAIILCLALADTAGAVTVRVRRAGEVTRAELKISDVAEVYGSDGDVARRVALTPLDSLRKENSRVVRIMEIKLALIKGGFNLAEIVVKGFSSCTVSLRRAAVKSRKRNDWSEDIETIARKAIADRVGAKMDEIELTPVSIPDEVEGLAASGHTFKFLKPRSLPNPGHIQLDLMAFKNSVFVKRLPVTYRFSLVVKCVVAAKMLRKGGIIHHLDVTVKPLVMSTARKGYYRSVNEVVGKEVTGTIIGGAALSSLNIKTAMLVKRNEIVRVVLRSSYVELESSAKALGSGARGDIISLEALEGRRKRYTGTVIAQRLVEVK